MVKKSNKEKVEYPFVMGSSTFTLHTGKDKQWLIRNFNPEQDGGSPYPKDKTERVLIQDPFGSVILVSAEEYVLLFNVLSAFFDQGACEESCCEEQPEQTETPQEEKPKKKTKRSKNVK